MCDCGNSVVARSQVRTFINPPYLPMAVSSYNHLCVTHANCGLTVLHCRITIISTVLHFATEPLLSCPVAFSPVHLWSQFPVCRNFELRAEWNRLPPAEPAAKLREQDYGYALAPMLTPSLMRECAACVLAYHSRFILGVQAWMVS